MNAETGTRKQAFDAGRSLAVSLRGVWRQRELLRELVRRELQESYAGTAFARIWAVLHPVLLIGLYLFVFGYVFQARAGIAPPSGADFAVFVLPGLAAWLTVAGALGRSTSLLLSSANLVKQVVFPIELLPLRSVLASHLPLLVGTAFVMAYALFRFQTLSPLVPLLVFVVAAQAALLAGLGLLLSAMTVFVRDVRDIVQFLTAMGLFLTPAVFMPGSLPGWFETILWLNPLSHAIWCLQDIFYFEAIRHPSSWLALASFAALFLWLGVRFFERTRSNFGDVL